MSSLYKIFYLIYRKTILYTMMFVSMLMGYATSDANAVNIVPDKAEQNLWSIPIAPQANLYQVDKLLYRSEQLKTQDGEIIKQQNIKSIINLRYFDRDEDQEYFSKQRLTIINIPIVAWAVKPKQLANILYQINQQQKQGKKVLVHCYHGADRTGITIAMYRIIHQGWTVEQAKSEMLYGGYGYHPIWQNLEKMLTTKNVDKVKAELAKLESH